jgi:uncharacterized protein YecE (DUF72 family)
MGKARTSAGSTQATVRYGPAGWDYKDWMGTVYPTGQGRAFDRLTYLAKFFDTVEINSTFYRPPTAEVAKRWAERVADNPRFRFTAKLYRRFTHERQTSFTQAEVAESRAAFEALAESKKLGGVLLQFPWSYRRTEENEEWLSDVLDAFGDFPLCVEVRHASWDATDFFARLSERGVGVVNIDQPLFHDSIRPSARATSPLGYIRVHGRNYKEWFQKNRAPGERYNYLYRADELRPWAERAKQLSEDVKELYIVTNNHMRGKAPANALQLQAMIEGGRVPVPPTLLSLYPDNLAAVAEPSS